MSNSPSFPNMPTDQSLPSTGMSDPMGTTYLEHKGQGPFQGKDTPQFGASKITATSKEGASYQGASGYGFMTNDASMKIQGNAPSGENSSGIPAAQPITPMTYGDPNNTAIDHQDGFNLPRE